MKKCLALLLMIAMTLSMAACGASQPAATEAPTEYIAPTEYLPYEGETLTVLYMSGVQADAARSMVPEFEAITGAKVEVMEAAYEDLHEQIQLDLVSYIGTYDVINMNSRWDGEFAPYLEPLDSYIAQDKYDMGVWIENVLANCGQWLDKTVGIPTACETDILAYRTDLLPNGIPNSWNDYRMTLSRLNKPSSGTYAIAVSKTPDQLLDMFNRVLWSMDGKWADEDWNVTINSTVCRSALNYMNAVKNFSDPACLEWTEAEAMQAFLEGKAVVCESLNIGDFLQMANDPELSQVADNWALGLFPKDKTGITTLTAWDAVIPVGSNNKDLAWEWIKMFTSYDMQNRFYEEHTIFSPRKAFWEQKKMADLSVVREALDFANCAWRISAYQEAEPNLSNTLHSFLTSKIYQDTVVRQFDAEIKTHLTNMPPEEGVKNQNH